MENLRVEKQGEVEKKAAVSRFVQAKNIDARLIQKTFKNKINQRPETENEVQRAMGIVAI